MFFESLPFSTCNDKNLKASTVDFLLGFNLVGKTADA